MTIPIFCNKYIDYTIFFRFQQIILFNLTFCNFCLYYYNVISNNEKRGAEMAPKNIDETIKKLLAAYAKWVQTVLTEKSEKLQKQKFDSLERRSKAERELASEKDALVFFLKIAAEPKKYLYSGKNIIYAGLETGKSLFDQLSPILCRPFDRSQKHLIVRLSEVIAHHAMYHKPDDVWVYYDHDYDSDAEDIMQMNKTVQLWNANELVAMFQNLKLPSAFAVNLREQESR